MIGNRQMLKLTGAAIAALAIPALHAGEPDFTISTALKQGQVIKGVGTVGTPSDVNVNNSGFWIATAPLTSPTGGAIITRDGVGMKVGDVLGGLYTVSSLTNAYKGLNNLGNIAHRPSFSGSPNSGLVLNQIPLILQNQISVAEAFSENTPYIGFFRARIDDSNRMFLVATVNDSELTGTVHRALVWVEYDEKTETITENVLAKRYDQLPGQPKGVIANEFGTGSERFDINNNGDAIYTVSFTGGDTATNAAIYVNHQLVAQKGQSGPLKDAVYNLTDSAATRVAINNNGDYVFMTGLSGGPTETNQVIMRNTLSSSAAGSVDQIVIRKGDPAPGIEGRTIISFGTGVPPQITDAGDVIWYGQLSGDTATNQALFINDRVIMQKGVTVVDGDLVTTVCGSTTTSNGIGDTLAVSDNGKYVVVRAVFNNNTNQSSVLLVEFEDAEPKCAGPADLNCDGSVDVLDLLILLGAWGDCPAAAGGCPADLNNSGTVDVQDLLILLGSWG